MIKCIEAKTIRAYITCRLIPLILQITDAYTGTRRYTFKPQHNLGGPRVVVSTAAFHASVRGSVPGIGDLKETQNVSSPSTCESQYCGDPP